LRERGTGPVCPVVFVGAQPRADGPVVLLLDDGASADGCAAAVEFAFAAAEQRHVGLLVIQAGLPEQGEPATCTAALAAQTDRQEQLDLALAGWQRQFPEVGVIAELCREPVDGAVRRVANAGQLVVLARGSTDLFASTECVPHQAAIAVVPVIGHRVARHERQQEDDRTGEKAPAAV
jgi:hypothetical protein